MSLRESFIPARSRVPVKMLLDLELMRSIVEEQRIIPRHLHLRPTNACNLDCEFCVSKNRYRDELPFERIALILSEAAALGCKAVTLSGGGEPLVHPDIRGIVACALDRNLRVGVTTNGSLIDCLPRGVTWCRVSMSHDRVVENWDAFSTHLALAVRANPNVVWSFNYVLTRADVNRVRTVIEFANRYGFSHVRVVPDINHLDLWRASRAWIAPKLKDIDQRVVYQTWPQHSRGVKKCWVSLLKPTFAADGRQVPCCGFEFPGRGARKEVNWPPDGSFSSAVEEQACFDGSDCEVCYYGNYNNLLQRLLDGAEHREWL